MFFFQLIIIIFLIFTIYSIIDIQKYNKHGFITEIKKYDIDKIIYELSLLNPLLLTIENKINYDYLLDNHLNNVFEDKEQVYSLKKINNIEQIQIFKNNNILNDFNLIEKINFDTTIFEKIPIPLLCYKKHSLSIFKGYNTIPIQFSKHYINVIYILEGEIIIYLFNPKHKNDIINKKLDNIKKYSHKYILKKNNVLIIPPNWYYTQESNDIVLQYHLDADNMFTVFYNLLR